MTLLHFTFGALPYHDQSKGTHIIHCWITQSEMTQTDDPGAERRAAKDARHILDDILLRNINTDEERLLQDGEMPAEVTPVFTFALGVAWDKPNSQPSYRRFDYATLCHDAKFAPVAQLGRELYDYTFKVLKDRERKDRAEAGLGKFSWDAVTVAHGRESFKAFCLFVGRRHRLWEINRRRFDCQKLRNGFCTPSDPKCPCYCNGRCVEVK